MSAFVFRVNVGCGPAEERHLLTGLHAVADIYCENCHTTLGWKYVSASTCKLNTSLSVVIPHSCLATRVNICCLFVNRITQKFTDRFIMGLIQPKSDCILDSIQIQI